MRKESDEVKDMTRQSRRQRRQYRNYAVGITGLLFAASIMLGGLAWKKLGDNENLPQTASVQSKTVGEDAAIAEGNNTEPVSAEPVGAETVSAEPISTDAEHTEGELQQADTPWYLEVVNKWNPITEDYNRKNLVEAADGVEVDERIYEPLMAMLEDAKQANDGQLPILASGYRTQERQQELYDEKIAEYRDQGYTEQEAVEEAQQWVAVPGTSEHQIGLAVDINGAIWDIYPWLQENSYKYGFIFRYPSSKTELTGVSEEVWHYRYVGEEAAAAIFEQGICLEEYIKQQEG